MRRAATSGAVTAGGPEDTGAELAGAELAGAELTGAELTGAETGAELTGAELTGAELTGAELAGAELAGAELTVTPPDGVVIDATAVLGGAALEAGPDEEAVELVPVAVPPTDLLQAVIDTRRPNTAVHPRSDIDRFMT